jgi:cell division protein FtsN
MTYDFAMDRKTVISVLAGWAVMGVLLFAAGWIVGLYWTTSGSASAATAGKTAGASEKEQAALPKEPVLREDAARTDVAAPGKATATSRQEISSPGGVAVAPPPPPSAAAGRSASGNKAATAPAVNDQEKIVQTDPEPPASATSAGSDDAVAKSVFTVQVGVFLDPNEAGRLLGAMEKHGYAPSVFSDKDAENRQWYAIRIGAYSDKDQASTAAANFTKQEKIKAVVRPLGSL